MKELSDSKTPGPKEGRKDGFMDISLLESFQFTPQNSSPATTETSVPSTPTPPLKRRLSYSCLINCMYQRKDPQMLPHGQLRMKNLARMKLHDLHTAP